MADFRRENQWHLKKEIPITLLLMVFIHSGAMIWGASKYDSRLIKVEETIANQQKARQIDREFHIGQRIRAWDRININGEKIQKNETGIARVEAEIKAANNTLDRISVYLMGKRQKG